MKVSVVILNWNGEKLLERFLPSVLENSPAEIAEIVVADNGSTDNSVALLKEKFPTVRLILLDQNYGFAEGYNRAIQLIDSEYTVLLNSDVEVTQNWLSKPIEILDSERDIVMVQPKILAERNRTYFEYAGAAGGFIDKYGYPFCRGRILNDVEKDSGQYDNQIDVLWASGACLFTRTYIYIREGGLDAGFFAHQEEIDFCWRLRSRGYRIVCTPQSVVYHVGGATLNVESPHKTFLNFRNNLLMLYKNLLDKDLKPVFRVRYVLDIVAALKFLVTGHPKNAQAIVRAIREFKRLQPEYQVKRAENLVKTTISNIPEIIRKNLLLNYYFLGKRTFSKLVGEGLKARR